MLEGDIIQYDFMKSCATLKNHNKKLNHMLKKLSKSRNIDLHKIYSMTTISKLPDQVSPYAYLSLSCRWVEFHNLMKFLWSSSSHLDSITI